jgi:N-acylneuraminate cytidylyltransferase
VPRKNIQPFRGKPLIVHSIEQSRAAELVTRTIVSTDDAEIARISRDAGADVPFLRPPEISGDFATDFEAFDHALGWLDEHEGYRPEIVVQVRCTCPLRPAGLIDEGIRRLQADPYADSLRAVIPAAHPPYKMWLLHGQYLKPLLSLPGVPEPYNEPRQRLPAVYWQNAYLDVIRWTTIMDKRSMTGERVLGLVMDGEHDVDIDSLRDMEQAAARAQESKAGL